MSSRTRITFVATNELAEFLEYEAEQRLATISSTEQQLLVESFLRDHATNESTRAIDPQLDLLHRHSDKIDYRGINAKHPYRVHERWCGGGREVVVIKAVLYTQGPF